MSSAVPRRGTWADADALVDQVIARVEGADPVSVADIRRHLELVGLDDAIHTDDAAARSHGFRAAVSPVCLLRTWSFPAYREPGGELDESGGLHPPIPLTSVPAPGGRMFATESSMRYVADVCVGDRIDATSVLRSVTRKRTRAGAGAFLVVETTYANQHGETVAVETLTTFRIEEEDEA